MNIVSRGKGKGGLTYGSPGVDVQETFTSSPMAGLIGTLRVRAEAKGATSTSRLRKIMSFLGGKRRN
jgi:hypothetical protein